MLNCQQTSVLWQVYPRLTFDLCLSLLVAHSKGKPLQRLASMSRGEKSLTVLSFIFSLQRYGPLHFMPLTKWICF
jgi:hypothetical protein